MNLLSCLALSSVLLGLITPIDAADISPYRKLSPPPLADLTLDDAFWSPRIRVNHEVTLPYCFDICESTGRVDNFRKAAGLMQGPFVGIWFNDSDVYKVLQAAACATTLRPDPALEKLADDVIRAIAAAQQSDGYLFCFFTIDHPEQRWKNIVNPARHEMYCTGHLIEAAAADYELTGKRELLDVARKLADHIGPCRRLAPSARPRPYRSLTSPDASRPQALPPRFHRAASARRPAQAPRSCHGPR